MNYNGNPKYEHDTPCCTGVLITNLGTPDNPTTSAVREYLAEFLSDSRVIELPKFLWWFILHGIILRIRPSQSAKAYKKIWTENGSPLLSISRKQVEGLKKILAKKIQGPIRMNWRCVMGAHQLNRGLRNYKRPIRKEFLYCPCIHNIHLQQQVQHLTQ